MAIWIQRLLGGYRGKGGVCAPVVYEHVRVASRADDRPIEVVNVREVRKTPFGVSRSMGAVGPVEVLPLAVGPGEARLALAVRVLKRAHSPR